MEFREKLIHGRLIKRYKRFLADVKLDDGSIVLAHCTNSGSMATCIEKDAEVFLTPVNDPARKTKFTWEMIKINGDWIGINTTNPNSLAFEFIKNNLIKDLGSFQILKREVSFDDSRFDIYGENDTEKCFIEVKNVTYREGNYALFPDAKTERGQKHLLTLEKAFNQGYRAVMIYIIQRSDVSIFAPAREIDPIYAALLKKVHSSGIEIIPIQVKVSPYQIIFDRILPFEL